MVSPAAVPQDFRERVTPFLQAHGFAGDCAIEPVAGGGNNRVYRVQTTAHAGLLKAYFRHAADPRDRFGTERAFYEFLWRNGVRRTPEPLGWDGPQRLALFTFVTGRKLRSDEVDGARVREAVEFTLEINAVRHSPAAQVLRPASEACFSLAQHIANVDRRVQRLEEIAPESGLDAEAAAFVRTELEPAWERIRARALGAPVAELAAELPADARCVSPSDFGFHNALLAPDGWLRFFDFEYAGWDDPAKLACDFFCQPQVPVPFRYRDDFLNRLAQALELDASFSMRVRLLQPAYQLKWCCIMLNDFVRGDQARRDFAKGATDADERRRMQLEKARQSLSSTMEM